MKKFCIVFIAFFFMILQAHGAESICFPKNDRVNPVSYNKSMNTIEEAEFKAAIQEVKDIYVPLIKEKFDADLVVVENWSDPTVNAYAQQSGKTWKVSMFGGLARDPLVTRDGFIGVICHEIGHHIGGSPMSSAWASDEGQSDYFATSKCMKRVFANQTVVNRRLYLNTEPTEDEKIAKTACEGVYKNDQDIALCYRSTLAGQSLARLLGSLGGNADVKFGTPDVKVVSRTSHSHPKGQCRMDTFFQGALCDRDKEIWGDKKDPSAGYCTSKDAYKIGTRPFCWFAPKDYGLDN